MQRSQYRQILALFWHYTRRYPALFSLGAGGAMLAVITQNIIPPYIVARAFSKLQYAYSHHQTLTFSVFTPYVVSFAVAMLLGALFWRIQSYCVWQFEIKVRRDLANDIYDHLQAQSQRFHADRFGGALVSQTNKLMGSYERLMDDFIWNIVPGFTTLLAAVSVLFFVSYPYALALLIITCAYLTIMSRRIIRQMPYNVAEAELESEQTAALADAITNMSSVRAFANETYESARFAGVTDRAYQAYRKLSVEVLKTEAISHFQTNTFQIVALGAGLLAVTHFDANVSVLYLVLSYTQNIVNQLWQFSRIVRNVNRSLGDAAEMTEILQIEPEVKDPPQPEESRIHRGAVAFAKVTFRYGENRKAPLFSGLELKIKPGEKVGLVGPSGGGKTTITKLLLRFMDIQKGQITIDGQDVATIRQSDLRSHIAYVAQEPMLFHRSIFENIRYGRHDASRKEVEAVARMASAHEFIEHLPHGYDTLVGERGVKLSGGQRQRIAIARAMLKNAP
ncbi:MAG TPA: ABC transporter ATP-binding protein, partial [Candidatus Saccharimonadales bacterium]|nr:ABC transporter ATP-binding protein [Candidatus Saccharimonadales bacterium]